MRTFKMGGIHPKENKLSAGIAAIKAHLPKHAIIPLAHYSGAPSQPIVEKGDMVKVGQVIGKADGYVSANVHASVSGKVSKIENALDASGYRRPTVFIEVHGDEWLEEIDQSTDLKRECILTPAEIIAKISTAGIVGLGGATFPAHVKLKIPEGKKADSLIINAVECEPYLTCDHRLMLEKGEEILVGVEIIMMALQVNKAFIGIENNKKDAIKHLTDLAKNYSGIKIVPLKVKYPQGSEKQLIESVIGRQTPNGALPIDVGAVVQNVATVFAIYEAVQKNKPLIERIVTITGKAMDETANFWVRLGTPLAEVVEQAGGIPSGTGKIVGGGPMMGRALMNLQVPTAKGSAGVLFLKTEEAERKTVKNCIRCSKCVNVCPMGLEPYLLMNQSELFMWPEMEKNLVMACIECGSCSYVCPSNRPLLDHIRYGKATVGGIIRNRK